MKQLILAIFLAIAAVFPATNSAANDDMMNMVVKIINDQNDPSVNAAWEAPYLIMNVKIAEDGCTEVNQLLADEKTAPMIKNMMLEEIIGDSEMLDVIIQLEQYGVKGLRLNITDSLGVKSTIFVTMDDIRAYQKEKGK